MMTATALAIANMIGIGVFTSLRFQVAGIRSGFSLLALWVVGGIVALSGALCYAELATALPRAGGEYNFLSRIWGRPWGVMAGWISATVGFAAPAALAAAAFGKYLAGVFPGAPPLTAAVALLWCATLVQLRGTRQASQFQDASTVLKIGLIVLFIVLGLTFGTPQPIRFAPSAADPEIIASAPFAISLVFVMYSYSGWNAATYIADEVRDQARVLPRSIIAAVLIVAALYVVLNAVFLYTTPIPALSGQLEVGLVAGRHILGEMGGRIAGAIICLGLVSSVSAMLWIGPRVAMAMGQDMAALAVLARRSRRGVPAIAILVQGVIATLLALSDSFEAVLDFIQFGLMASSFLAVAGLMWLRRTEPELPRPYRVWAYPLPPLLFLAVTLFMMVHLIIERPLQSLAGCGMMLAGLALHFLSKRSQS